MGLGQPTSSVIGEPAPGRRSAPRIDGLHLALHTCAPGSSHPRTCLFTPARARTCLFTPAPPESNSHLAQETFRSTREHPSS